MENDKGSIDYLVAERAQGFGTRKSGERVRNDVLNIYEQTKTSINLDFKNINVISSSFADELVGKLVIKLGFFGFNNVIRLKNMNPLVQSILQRSVAQRMAVSMDLELEEE